MAIGDTAARAIFKPVRIMDVVALSVTAGLPAAHAQTAPVQADWVVPETSLDQGIRAYDQGRLTDAVTILRPLAEQGDADAQTYLGWIYETPAVTIDGQRPAISPDNATARYWYEKAAAQGQARAMNNLGSLYFLGRGIARDVTKGVGLFRQAAQLGDRQAQVNLAAIYYDGIAGVPADRTAAAHWASQAAIQGDRGAQLALAKLYDDGDGVARNPTAAYALVLLSGGADTDASILKTKLEDELSAAQKAEAQTLARNWQPGQPLPTATRT